VEREPRWGVNKTGFTLRDTNALGTGVLIGATAPPMPIAPKPSTASRSSGFRRLDRINYSHSRSATARATRCRSLGRSTPWIRAGPRIGLHGHRIDSAHTAVASFATAGRAETSGGWSAGLVDHWTIVFGGLELLKIPIQPDPPSPAIHFR